MRKIFMIIAISLLLAACTQSASNKTPEPTSETVSLVSPTPEPLPIVQPTPLPAPVANSSFCPGTLSTRLKAGVQARVDPDQPLPNNVRAWPGTETELVGQINQGDSVTIIDGPACRGELIWWEVELADGTTGWTAESDNETYWLEPAGIGISPTATMAPTPTP